MTWQDSLLHISRSAVNRCVFRDMRPGFSVPWGAVSEELGRFSDEQPTLEAAHYARARTVLDRSPHGRSASRRRQGNRSLGDERSARDSPLLPNHGHFGELCCVPHIRLTPGLPSNARCAALISVVSARIRPRMCRGSRAIQDPSDERYASIDKCGADSETHGLRPGRRRLAGHG